MARSVIIVVALALLATPARGLDITACGVTVPVGETGVLQADLACPTQTTGVVLSGGTTLLLNGHTIAGDFTTTAAVVCQRSRCTINGPGAIVGSDAVNGLSSAGVELAYRVRLLISDVAMHGSDFGILADGARIFASNLDVSGNGTGIAGVKLLRATGLTASGNVEAGIVGNRVRLEDATVSANGHHGIFAARVAATRLTANDNGSAGVRAVRAGLTDSTVLGNGTLDTGVDIATTRPPRLLGTACGRSGQLGGVGSWGVCAND